MSPLKVLKVMTYSGAYKNKKIELPKYLSEECL